MNKFFTLVGLVVCALPVMGFSRSEFFNAIQSVNIHGNSDFVTPEDSRFAQKWKNLVEASKHYAGEHNISDAYALVDCTVFGSAEDGVLFDARGVTVHNGVMCTGANNGFISWDDFFKKYNVRYYDENSILICSSPMISINVARSSVSRECMKAFFVALCNAPTKLAKECLNKRDCEGFASYRDYFDTSDSDIQFAMGWCLASGKGFGKKDPIGALEWYNLAAEQGSLAALNNIGLLYENGDLGEVNYGKACEYYLKAAKGGNPLAMYNYADMNEYGKGVKKNLGIAKSWYVAAAEKGYESAKNAVSRIEAIEKNTELAIDRFEAGDYEGFASYRDKFDDSDMDIQLLMGRCYQMGVGFGKKDMEEALKWYNLAAKQGCLIAMNNIGFMYMNGDLGDIDYSKAREWFLKAAENGYATAMINCGFLCENGLGGVEKSYTKAEEWYKKALAVKDITDDFKKKTNECIKLLHDKIEQEEEQKFKEERASRPKLESFCGIKFGAEVSSTTRISNGRYIIAKKALPTPLNGVEYAYVLAGVKSKKIFCIQIPTTVSESVITKKYGVEGSLRGTWHVREYMGIPKKQGEYYDEADDIHSDRLERLRQDLSPYNNDMCRAQMFTLNDSRIVKVLGRLEESRWDNYLVNYKFRGGMFAVNEEFEALADKEYLEESGGDGSKVL